MKSVLFIRSCPRDYPWLHYCLRSIQKFATGFDIQLVIPNHNVHFLPPIARKGIDDGSIKAMMYNEHDGKGMLQSMLCALEADLICPDHEFFYFFDSDCIFTKPVSPSSYIDFNNHKLLFPIESYTNLASDPDAGKRARLKWQSATERAIGWQPQHSTMVRMPVVHHRDVFQYCRSIMSAHTGKRPSEYVLGFEGSGYEGEFSEFEALGAVALYSIPEKYHVCDASIDPFHRGGAGGRHSARFDKVQCYWSHGGISPQIRAEIETILA